MKIYFAGSIRGGREDVDLYVEIINLLKKYGTVLTEHIGNKAISSYGQKNLSNEQIYTKDTEWIKEADIVIAEVTTVSLGVGYEIGFAESINKKIIALYRPQENKRLSAMIAGNKNIMVFEYENIFDLENIFKDLMK